MSTITSSGSVIARFADRLARSVGSQKYQMWFDGAARFDYDDGRRCLEMRVPNRFVADWIDRHFQPQIQAAADDVIGAGVALAVRIDADGFKASAAAPSPAPAPPRGATAAATPRRAAPGHRLEEFVVGPSNELAYAAATNMAEEDPGAAGTLVVHGGCGLGKTHLLQGLCRRLKQRRPEARIWYTTAEQFTNAFLGAMRANRLDGFRRRVRSVDLLAVDDVHFLAGKQATQQEFLHSFDAMDQGGARVALASDSHPKLIEHLSEALVSRCLRGMVVQVHVPDTVTRARIVGALAQRRGLSLVDGMIEALAARCLGSVREIQGTLTKLHALARLADERRDGGTGHDPIGRALLDRLFDAENQMQPSRAVDVATITMAVAHACDVEPDEVRGHSRRRHHVLARSLVAHLARRLTSMSYPEIATALNRSNHSTIIGADRRITKMLADQVCVNLRGSLEPVPVAELLQRAHRRVLRGDRQR